MKPHGPAVALAPPTPRPPEYLGRVDAWTRDSGLAGRPSLAAVSTRPSSVTACRRRRLASASFPPPPLAPVRLCSDHACSGVVVAADPCAVDAVPCAHITRDGLLSCMHPCNLHRQVLDLNHVTIHQLGGLSGRGTNRPPPPPPFSPFSPSCMYRVQLHPRRLHILSLSRRAPPRRSRPRAFSAAGVPHVPAAPSHAAPAAERPPVYQSACPFPGHPSAAPPKSLPLPPLHLPERLLPSHPAPSPVAHILDLGSPAPHLRRARPRGPIPCRDPSLVVILGVADAHGTYIHVDSRGRVPVDTLDAGATPAAGPLAPPPRGAPGGAARKSE